MSLRSALLDTTNPFNWMARFKALPNSVPSGQDSKLLHIAAMDSGDYWKRLLGKRHISPELLRKLLKDLPSVLDDELDEIDTDAEVIPGTPESGGETTPTNLADAMEEAADGDESEAEEDGGAAQEGKDEEASVAGTTDPERDALLAALNGEGIATDTNLQFVPVGGGQGRNITILYNGLTVAQLNPAERNLVYRELRNRNSKVVDKTSTEAKRIQYQLGQLQIKFPDVRSPAAGAAGAGAGARTEG